MPVNKTGNISGFVSVGVCVFFFVCVCFRPQLCHLIFVKTQTKVQPGFCVLLTTRYRLIKQELSQIFVCFAFGSLLGHSLVKTQRRVQSGSSMLLDAINIYWLIKQELSHRHSLSFYFIFFFSFSFSQFGDNSDKSTVGFFSAFPKFNPGFSLRVWY